MIDRSPTEPDYYAVLGVRNDATQGEIERAYRRMAGRRERAVFRPGKASASYPRSTRPICRPADDGVEARQPRPGRLRHPACDLALLEAMLAKDIIPVVPAQGSVGASGDLAPLSHMTAVMIGVGECFTPLATVSAAEALVSAGLEPVDARAKEGLALLNGTQFSTAYALAALFEAEELFQRGAGHRRAVDRCRQGSDAPFDPRIHALRRHRGQIETAEALRELMARQRHPRIAPRRRRARAGPLLPALPAAGDGRSARRAAPGRRHARHRGQRRLRQSADLRRGRTKRSRAAISTPSRWRSPPT